MLKNSGNKLFNVFRFVICRNANQQSQLAILSLVLNVKNAIIHYQNMMNEANRQIIRIPASVSVIFLTLIRALLD